MERTIGNLGEEIRQPSNPFANLSQRGLLRCQVNALTAMVPALKPPNCDLPRGAMNIGDKYILLRARDRYHSGHETSRARGSQDILPKPARTSDIS